MVDTLKRLKKLEDIIESNDRIYKKNLAVNFKRSMMSYVKPMQYC